MTKTKAKKSSKKQCKLKCCPLTGILVLLTVGLTIFSGYLLANQKSFEEKKRLQAFETLLDSDIKDMLYVYEKDADYWSTETGLTADNDLYVKFRYLQYEDNERTIPSYTNTGVIYYPCSSNSGKTITLKYEDLEPCGKHIELDNNKKEVSAEIKNKAAEYARRTSEISKITEAIYAAARVNTDEGWTLDFDRLTQEQNDTLRNLRDEETRLSEEYEKMMDQIWD
jgi:hypothetical protein